MHPLGGMLFGLILILYWRKDARRKAYGFSSWKEYSSKKKSFWDRFKESKSETKFQSAKPVEKPEPKTDPMDERRAQQEEIDRILEKVKRSGYSCLTEEEKRTIFDFRNKR